MKTRRGICFPLLLMLVFFLPGCTSSADPDILVVSEPEEAGFSAERLNRIDQVVNQYVEEGKIPGAAALIARHGKIVYHKSFGYRDREEEDPLEKDDIFRIASMTKALTSVCVMMLYEEGHFDLDDPVSRFIPEFAEMKVLESVNDDNSFETVPAEKDITIRHLLTHTSGIGYPFIHEEIRSLCEELGIPDGFVTTDAVLADAIPRLGQVPLLHQPGEAFTYGLNTDVLGYLVEVVTGQTFEEFLTERLFVPLGMEDAHFYLPGEKVARLTPVYSSTQDGLRRNEDPWFDYPFSGGKSYFSGGAGISCTILDYARFMQMMINGGAYNGQQILAPKTIDLMTMNQTGDLRGDGAFGLGFSIVTEETKHLILSSVGNYSWGGYFSTSYWMDPKEDLIGLFFVQMDPNWHAEIHPRFQVLTYQALTE